MITIFISAVLVFILLLFISAPYGKFLRKGWGEKIRSKWAWMLMGINDMVLAGFVFLCLYNSESVAKGNQFT